VAQLDFINQRRVIIVGARAVHRPHQQIRRQPEPDIAAAMATYVKTAIIAGYSVAATSVAAIRSPLPTATVMAAPE
jgi:hypothetical protein